MKALIRTSIPGPRSREVVAREQEHLAPGLQSFALWSGVAMDHGEGSVLTDVDGNRYVDLIGGIGVNALGHCHPRYVEALARQAARLTVGSFTSVPRAELVHAVCGLAPAGLDRLQLYSSGAEAVESALRLARQRDRPLRGGRLLGRLPRQDRRRRRAPRQPGPRQASGRCRPAPPPSPTPTATAAPSASSDRAAGWPAPSTRAGPCAPSRPARSRRCWSSPCRAPPATSSRHRSSSRPWPRRPMRPARSSWPTR